MTSLLSVLWIATFSSSIRVIESYPTGWSRLTANEPRATLPPRSATPSHWGPEGAFYGARVESCGTTALNMARRISEPTTGHRCLTPSTRISHRSCGRTGRSRRLSDKRGPILGVSMRSCWDSALCKLIATVVVANPGDAHTCSNWRGRPRSRLWARIGLSRRREHHELDLDSGPRHVRERARVRGRPDRRRCQ
jgi:hypothetical protein